MGNAETILQILDTAAGKRCLYIRFFFIYFFLVPFFCCWSTCCVHMCTSAYICICAICNRIWNEWNEAWFFCHIYLSDEYVGCQPGCLYIYFQWVNSTPHGILCAAFCVYLCMSNLQFFFLSFLVPIKEYESKKKGHQRYLKFKSYASNTISNFVCRNKKDKKCRECRNLMKCTCEM